MRETKREPVIFSIAFEQCGEGAQAGRIVELGSASAPCLVLNLSITVLRSNI